jgi:tetratricopeptide (TPR) repeat protein
VRRNKNLKELPKIQAAVILCLAILLSIPAISQRSKKGSKKKVATAEQISQEVEYLFIEAEKLFILKNYSQSTELLNRCIALDPDNDVVYYKLAEINNNTEQYDAAVVFIAKAIAINKSNKYYYLLAVDIHSNMGNLQEAANNYESLVKEVAKTEFYLFNLAALYIYLKEYDKALQTYNNAEKAIGLTEEISSQRQKVYLQQNKLEEAINEGRLLIAKYPDNPRYILLLVEILSSNNRLDEAKDELKKLLAKNPDLSAARLQLADIHWKELNYTEFSRELKLAFSDNELALNAKINTVMKYMVYLPNEHLQNLIPQLADEITLKHKDDSNAYLISGDVYSAFLEKQLLSGDEVERAKIKAVSAYSKYVALDPSNYSVWQNLLNLELQLDLQDSLAVHADQALVLFPNQAWIYLVNGIVQQNQKNGKAAAELLEMGSLRATSNKALLMIIYSYLGDVYNELNEYSKSDKAYESVLELDPLNYTVLNNFSYYLSLREEKLELAKKMSTTLIRNNPDNITYLDTYAWVHFTLGDYIEAKRIFEKIIASDVDQGVYYDHYGDTLYKLGETNEAINQWSKARELDKSIENIDEKINQGKIIQ